MWRNEFPSLPEMEELEERVQTLEMMQLAETGFLEASPLRSSGSFRNHCGNKPREHCDCVLS
jgi:hypothetical protein